MPGGSAKGINKESSIEGKLFDFLLKIFLSKKGEKEGRWRRFLRRYKDLFRRSPLGAFHMEGIPAAVAAYQGDEAFMLDPNYHTPIDTVEDNVSEGRIQKAFDIHKKAIMMADEAVEVPDVARNVHMYIDSTTYEIDGVEDELDVALFIEDDRRKDD